MKPQLITLTTDFAVQSQGIGIMEAVIYKINPDAKVIHLMHGLPDFSLMYAARTMETVSTIPLSGLHVCVVDPGVGTKRKPIIIKTKRGDCLIGPDNGVLIPAAGFLGGIKKTIEITNKKYMNHPISPIFHGRDIFAPAAAYLSKGIKLESFGKELNPKNLTKSPYEEAIITNEELKATIISINKFGSLHLNIRHSAWDSCKLKIRDKVKLIFHKNSIDAPFVKTFGDVQAGKPLILKDDYGRIQVSLNQDSFAGKYGVRIGDDIKILFL